MVEKVGEKWILAWIVVHSAVLLVLFMAILATGFLEQQRMDSMSILLHKRVSELAEILDKQGHEIMELKIQYDPHDRLQELEKWQRTFCTGPKIEACALLKRIDK